MSRHRRPLAAALLAVLAAGALTSCSRSDATPAPAAQPPAAAAPVGVGTALTDSVSASADRGRIRGAEGAQVWLIEISDFQCPYCKGFHDETGEAIHREYVQTGKVRHAFLNFPLSSIHPNAQGAAEAAMCASAQGKFWEVQDALFDTQGVWGRMGDAMPHFESLATTAGVEPAAWRRCMTSHATAALIAADVDRSTRAGISSTPSFFVGNRALIGAYPIDSFRVVLDAAIANAKPR